MLAYISLLDRVGREAILVADHIVVLKATLKWSVSSLPHFIDKSFVALVARDLSSPPLEALPTKSKTPTMSSTNSIDIEKARSAFPSLKSGYIFADNAGGSQCLRTVVDRVSDYLLNTNVQLGEPRAVFVLHKKKELINHILKARITASLR